jgi:hypothetical protein
LRYCLGATLANKGWGAHFLDLEGIAIIAREDFLDPAS